MKDRSMELTTKQIIEIMKAVKHDAHWIISHGTNGETDFVCSSCFCISPIRGYTRYCPNCGARMDGEIEGKRK